MTSLYHAILFFYILGTAPRLLPGLYIYYDKLISCFIFLFFFIFFIFFYYSHIYTQPQICFSKTSTRGTPTPYPQLPTVMDPNRLAQLVALEPVRDIHKRKAIDSPPSQEDEQRAAKRRQVAQMIDELIQESSARQIQEKDQQLKLLQDQQGNSEAVLQQLQEGADSCVDKLEEAVNALEAQEVVLDDTKLKLDTAVSANATISTAAAMAATAAQNAQKALEISEADKAQLQQEIAEINRIKAKLCIDIATIKQDFEKERREATEAKALLKQYIAKLEQEATEAKDQRKQDLAQRQQDLDKFKQEATEAKDQLKQEIAQRQQDLAQRQLDIAKLKQEATEAKDQHHQDLAQCQQDLAQRQQDFDKLKQEATEVNAQHTQALAQCQLDIAKLKQEATEANDQLKQDLAQRQQDFDKLTESLAEANTRNIELEGNAEYANKCNTRYSRLSIDFDDLKIALKESQAAHAASLQAAPPRPNNNCRPGVSYANGAALSYANGAAFALNQPSHTTGPVHQQRDLGGVSYATAVHPNQQQGYGGGAAAVHPNYQQAYLGGPPAVHPNQQQGYTGDAQDVRRNQPQGVRPDFTHAGEGFQAQVEGDGGLPPINQMDVERIVSEDTAAPPQVSAGVPRGGQAARVEQQGEGGDQSLSLIDQDNAKLFEELDGYGDSINAVLGNWDPPRRWWIKYFRQSVSLCPGFRV